MSRTFTIKELNEKIDREILRYELDYEDAKNQKDSIEALECVSKINALADLKLELNSPEPLVNVTEKVQESLNIIETNKIIKDGL